MLSIRECGGLTERFFLHDPALVFRIFQDCRSDEIPLPIRILPTHDNLLALLLDLLEETLHPLILHAILHWTEEDALLIALANLERLRVPHHGIPELVKDGLVDKDTFQSQTDLTTVQEGQHGDLGRHLLNVDVVQDDGWIVAAKLQGDALQRGRGGCHDFLARRRAAGEADFARTGVCGHPRTEVVVAGEALEDTRWEEALAKLAELEIAARGERGGFDDNGVAGQEGWGDLAAREEDGVVPGDDANRGSQRDIANEHLPMCLVDDLLRGQVECGDRAHDL